MAELISEQEIANIRLFTFELSSGELDAIVACLNYVLTHTTDEQLEQLTGAYRDELEAIRDDLTLFPASDNQETVSEQQETQPA